MGLTQDISDLLTSGGVTATIYQGFMPPSPNDAVCIVETGGFPPLRAMPGSAGRGGVGAGLIVVERPTVQVMRRSMSPQLARVDMGYILRLLDGAGDRNINGTRYNLISAMQSPFPLPEDETGRTLIVCNFMAEKALTTATST